MNTDNSSTIISTALRTLDIEIEVLQKLRSGINGDFCEVVEAIHRSRGRVVVTGIGKSAIVAQKITATLNSTGTPSLFMHAADAVHGDLGMIQPYDILLCLSKSGDTAEIKVLLPLVKGMGNTVVGMVAKPDSWLGKQADHLLLTPVPQEADPNNLAPTASTTAQMAMGDALAVSLLALRGFEPHDFAQFHPGGTLGKQLYLRVGDLYPQNEKPGVQLETPLHKTILEMTSKRLGCTAVLGENNKVAGIITDGDLRRMLEHGQADMSRLKAADIMSENPKTIAAGALAVKALEAMRENSITQLLVEEDGQYVGVVHLHDLVREGIV
ncbi:MAG TPA: KpsF/GutQ family sugar-phosphate isomerase [Bacteroidetes bacterium]|nr:KpsF/GutQ family sugar-phosphate isomerase [Bacteroidota bacterium]